jgi:hypothetical protein
MSAFWEASEDERSSTSEADKAEFLQEKSRTIHFV